MLLSIVFVLLGIWLLLKQVRESFVPEFLDQTMVKRTAETKDSSYAQRTNHLSQLPETVVPVSGEPTPFRVNAYTAYLG